MSLATRALATPHGTLELPLFLPDATQGVVRAVDTRDLAECGVTALQTNVFHLMQRPGSSTIQAMGGLHPMMAWDRPIITDSGGFQAYSLVRQGPRFGRMGDDGIDFRPEGAERSFRFTPAKSVQLQLRYGADIVVCLDDCTSPEDPLPVQEESVRRTIKWARRCKAEFEQLVEQKGLEGDRRPLLLAVVQGGTSLELRRQCAEALLEIGFDAYGYGGWPLDAEGRLLLEIFSYIRRLIPPQFPLHALGVGHPAYVVDVVRAGYGLVDSVMPTRDARHGRLYTFTGDPAEPLGDEEGWFRYVYVGDNKHIKADAPVSPWCDGPCCRRYSLGYLHHLYKLDDCLYHRLATMHNLRFMMRLMERLRRET